MAERDLGTPAAWSVGLHTATVNGITMRWADTARTAADRAKPVILMMHGWPESWFSYRHQLRAIAASGSFRGIAPDMRGYGGTDSPAHYADYNCYVLAADMIALLAHLGHWREQAQSALGGDDRGVVSLEFAVYLKPPRFRTVARVRNIWRCRAIEERSVCSSHERPRASRERSRRIQ